MDFITQTAYPRDFELHALRVAITDLKDEIQVANGTNAHVN